MNFESLNNYFDKIFVITLKCSTDRQGNISKVLDGLNYELFYGADKNDLSIEELKDKNIYNEGLAVKHHRYNKPMNAGQIGCALSHTMIYKRIINDGYNKVLILEDDVQPIHESLQFFIDITEELPDDWELLYFDYFKNEKPKPLKKLWYHLQRMAGGLKWDHTIINNLYPKNLGQHISCAGFHDYTDAYGITLSGAKKLLHLQTPVSYVADNLLAIASASKKLNAFITHPKLFNQLSQGESTTFDSQL